MSIQQNKAALARETCLEALAIAIPRLCKKHLLFFENNPFNDGWYRYNKFRILRLCCKRLKQVVDELMTSLWVHDRQTDFDILTPALLRNVRKLDISPIRQFDHNEVIESYLLDLKRILLLTAPILRELKICRVPVPLALLIEGLAFPNLERLSLGGMEGNISGARVGLYSMQELRYLSLDGQGLNKADFKVLLSTPFLSNLTRLALDMAARALTTKYMKLLLRGASSLKILDLNIGCSQRCFSDVSGKLNFFSICRNYFP